MNPVADIIDYHLQILFIGFNPSLTSSKTGHHFANPSNRFWRLLAEAALTPCRLSPAEDQRLLEYGLGITNIVSRPTRSAAEITKEEYRSGRKEVLEKLAGYKPKIACYVGIGVYQQLTGIKKVHCGIQIPGVITGITDYVLSSSSGLNRIPLEQQLSLYIALKRMITV